MFTLAKLEFVAKNRDGSDAHWLMFGPLGEDSQTDAIPHAGLQQCETLDDVLVWFRQNHSEFMTDIQFNVDQFKPDVWIVKYSYISTLERT